MTRGLQPALTNAPTARAMHTAVWTGSEMIVWGGSDGIQRFEHRRADTIPAPTVGQPPAPPTRPLPERSHGSLDRQRNDRLGRRRRQHHLNTGGRYNPSTDSWTATSTTNAPAARVVHTAVWTGSEMIVWGGLNRRQLFEHRRQIQSRAPIVGRPPAPPTRPLPDTVTQQCGPAVK